MFHVPPPLLNLPAFSLWRFWQLLDFVFLWTPFLGEVLPRQDEAFWGAGGNDCSVSLTDYRCTRIARTYGTTSYSFAFLRSSQTGSWIGLLQFSSFHSRFFGLELLSVYKTPQSVSKILTGVSAQTFMAVKAGLTLQDVCNWSNR